MLVSLTITQWSARKYDRKVTQEVNTNHNASDAGRFNKLLIGKDHLKEIETVIGEARRFHADNTLPWADAGDRLLPSANYFAYTGEMSKIKNKFESVVNKFCKEYPLLVDEAKTKLNTLFNLEDYPNDILDRFSFKTVFMPIPQTTDFRVDIPQADIDSLTHEIQAEVNGRFAAATQSIYKRITDQLRKMHERLSEPDNVFRDTLFENLKNLIDLLPRLNVGGDPVIDSLCNDMKVLLVDPADVRNDNDLRTQKANEVDAMLKSLNWFMHPQQKENPVAV